MEWGGGGNKEFWLLGKRLKYLGYGNAWRESGEIIRYDGKQSFVINFLSIFFSSLLKSISLINVKPRLFLISPINKFARLRAKK